MPTDAADRRQPKPKAPPKRPAPTPTVHLHLFPGLHKPPAPTPRARRQARIAVKKPAPRIVTDTRSSAAKPKPKPKPRVGGQLVPSVRHPFDIVPPTTAEKIGRHVITTQRRAQAKEAAAAKRTYRTYVPTPPAIKRLDRQVNVLANRAENDPSLSFPERQALRAKAHTLAARRDAKLKHLEAAGMMLPKPVGGYIGTAIRSTAGMAIAMPGGAWHIAKGTGLDVYDAARLKSFTFKHSRKTAEEMVKSTVALAKDPLSAKNLPATLLTISGAGAGGASAVLRGLATKGAATAARAEGASIIRAGAAGLKAGAKRPVPGVRIIRHGDLKEVATYSEHPLIQAGQKLRDRRAAGQHSARFVGKEVAQGQRIRHARDTADQVALLRRSRYVSTPQHAAIKSVGENTPPKVRAANELERAKQAKNPLQARRHRQKAKLYERADAYTKVVDGHVVIDTEAKAGRTVTDWLRRKGVTGPELERALGHTQRVADKRETTLTRTGHLQHGQVVYRKAAPGLIEKGAKHQKYTIGEERAGVSDPATRYVQQLRDQAAKVPPDTPLPPDGFGPAGVTGSTARTYGEKVAELDKQLAEAKRPVSTEGLVGKHVNPRDRMNIGRITAVDEKTGVAEVKFHNKETGLRATRHFPLTELEPHRGGTGRLVMPEEKVTRPRTEQEAHARLATLEGQYNTVVDNLAGKWTKQDASEQARRNIINAKIDKARSGKDALGRAKGSSSKYTGMERRALVKDEKFRQAEADLEKVMHGRLKKDPSDEAAKTFFAQVAEIDKLRGELGRRKIEALGPDPGRAPVTAFGSPEGLPFEQQVARARQLAKDKRDQNGAPLGERTVQTYRDVGPAELAGQGGKFRVPSTPTRATRAIHFPARRSGEIISGKTRTPSTLTQGYKGALRATGREREDTMRLVAESGLEAQKFARTLSNREKLLKAASDERVNPDDVPIRPAELTGALRPEVRAALQKAEEGLPLSKADRQFLGHAATEFDESVFPDAKSVLHEAGIKWVPRKLAEGLVPTYRGGSVAIEKVAKGADVINTAQKMAVLYLKPAYLTPNLLGQTALVLTRQGFLAPVNIARAVRLQRTFGVEDATIIRAIMDDGMVKALAPMSKLGTINSKVAGFYGKILDTPFRDASFLHEARRMGFKSPEEVHALLHDPAHEAELVTAARRASESIIDYGRLGPTEQALLSRVIFFYPWLKGSARYAKHFVTEHPVQAAVYANVGQQQQARNERELGQLPEFMSGYFKVGERAVPGLGRVPLVSNPAAATILGQPAQIVDDFLKHGPAAIPKYLSPTGALTMAEVTRTDPLTGQKYPDYMTEGEIALNQLSSGLPQKVLAERTGLVGSKPAPADTYYPMTGVDAILQFTVGTVSPRPLNLEKAHKRARKDKLDSLHMIDRIDYQRDEALQQIPKVLKQLPGARHLGPVIRTSIELEHARQHALQATADREGKRVGDLSPAEQAHIEANVLHAAGRMTHREVALIVSRANKAQKEGKGPDVSKAWSEIWNERIPNVGGRSVFNAWVDALKKKGIDYLGRNR